MQKVGAKCAGPLSHGEPLKELSKDLSWLLSDSYNKALTFKLTKNKRNNDNDIAI